MNKSILKKLCILFLILSILLPITTYEIGQIFYPRIICVETDPAIIRLEGYIGILQHDGFNIVPSQMNVPLLYIGISNFTTYEDFAKLSNVKDIGYIATVSDFAVRGILNIMPVLKYGSWFNAISN